MQTLHICGEPGLAGVHSAGTAALTGVTNNGESNESAKNATTFEAAVRAERINQSEWETKHCRLTDGAVSHRVNKHERRGLRGIRLRLPLLGWLAEAKLLVFLLKN
jgi:hypothetical protein